MANSTQMKSIKMIAEQYNSLIARSPQCLEYLVRERIYMSPEKLGKNEKSFIEAAATHPAQEVRSFACDALFTALTAMRAQNVDIAESQKIIEALLAQMDTECQKHWMRLEEYLKLLWRLMMDNTDYLRMMIEQRIVSRGIELFQKHKASALYDVATPPLGYLVQLIVGPPLLVPRLADPNDEKPQLQGEELLAALLDPSLQTGFNRQLTTIYATEDLDITSAAFWLQLPDPCVAALFARTKAHKEMLQAITKNGFALDSFKKFIAHLCYENREFSVRTAKFILKGTN